MEIDNKECKLLIIWAFVQLGKDCEIQEVSHRDYIGRELDPEAAALEGKSLARWTLVKWER